MHTKQGTKRLYELDRSGVTELRDWVDGFWSEALVRFKEAAEQRGGTT